MDGSGGGKALWDYISFGLTCWWVVVLSAWGGMVSYFHNLGRHGLKFSLLRLFVDISTSAFVGILTYLLCRATIRSEEVTAAMVGISGHMGTRALFMLEKRYEKLFGTMEDRNDGKDQ